MSISMLQASFEIGKREYSYKEKVKQTVKQSQQGDFNHPLNFPFDLTVMQIIIIVNIIQSDLMS